MREVAHLYTHFPLVCGKLFVRTSPREAVGENILPLLVKIDTMYAKCQTVGMILWLIFFVFLFFL